MLALLFVGCDVFNPDEQEPSFLKINSFDLSTSVAQGTPTHGISEMWVYVNGDVQGVFDVPSNVPILREGKNTVSIFAGIKNNGLGTTRIRYPFYLSYDTIIDFQPLQTYEVNPRFSYFANAQINISRDFESGNFFQPSPTNLGDFELINNPAIAIGGSRCGKATLTAPDTYMQFIDDNVLVLEAGNTAFLEMDYSCNNTFALGVYVIESGDQDKTQVVYLTPTTSDSGDNPAWNKIYIDLGMVTALSPNADYYKFFIECVSSESATPTVYLDNLKIVKW